MGKYSSSSRRPPAPKRDRMPALVRGIGCILFVIIPIVAYEVSKLVAAGPARAWGFIPREWFSAPQLPEALRNLEGIRNAWAFVLANVNLTTLNLILTAVITVVIYGIMSIIYGYMYSMMAPSRYGPTDVPPPRVKTKKYTR